MKKHAAWPCEGHGSRRRRDTDNNSYTGDTRCTTTTTKPRHLGAEDPLEDKQSLAAAAAAASWRQPLIRNIGVVGGPELGRVELTTRDPRQLPPTAQSATTPAIISKMAHTSERLALMSMGCAGETAGHRAPREHNPNYRGRRQSRSNRSRSASRASGKTGALSPLSARQQQSRCRSSLGATPLLLLLPSVAVVATLVCCAVMATYGDAQVAANQTTTGTAAGGPQPRRHLGAWISLPSAHAAQSSSSPSGSSVDSRESGSEANQTAGTRLDGGGGGGENRLFGQRILVTAGHDNSSSSSSGGVASERSALGRLSRTMRHLNATLARANNVAKFDYETTKLGGSLFNSMQHLRSISSRGAGRAATTSPTGGEGANSTNNGASVRLGDRPNLPLDTWAKLINRHMNISALQQQPPPPPLPPNHQHGNLSNSTWSSASYDLAGQPPPPTAQPLTPGALGRAATGAFQVARPMGDSAQESSLSVGILIRSPPARDRDRDRDHAGRLNGSSSASLSGQTIMRMDDVGDEGDRLAIASQLEPTPTWLANQSATVFPVAGGPGGNPPAQTGPAAANDWQTAASTTDARDIRAVIKLEDDNNGGGGGGGQSTNQLDGSNKFSAAASEHLRGHDTAANWSSSGHGSEFAATAGNKSAASTLGELVDAGHDKHGWLNVYHREEYADHQKYHDLYRDKDSLDRQDKWRADHSTNSGSKYNDSLERSYLDKDKHASKYDYRKGSEWRRSESANGDHDSNNEDDERESQVAASHQQADEGGDDGDREDHSNQVIGVGVSDPRSRSPSGGGGGGSGSSAGQTRKKPRMMPVVGAMSQQSTQISPTMQLSGGNRSVSRQPDDQQQQQQQHEDNSISEDELILEQMKARLDRLSERAHLRGTSQRLATPTDPATIQTAATAHAPNSTTTTATTSSGANKANNSNQSINDILQLARRYNSQNNNNNSGKQSGSNIGALGKSRPPKSSSQASVTTSTANTGDRDDDNDTDNDGASDDDEPESPGYGDHQPAVGGRGSSSPSPPPPTSPVSTLTTGNGDTVTVSRLDLDKRNELRLKLELDLGKSSSPAAHLAPQASRQPLPLQQQQPLQAAKSQSIQSKTARNSTSQVLTNSLGHAIGSKRARGQHELAGDGQTVGKPLSHSTSSSSSSSWRDQRRDQQQQQPAPNSSWPPTTTASNQADKRNQHLNGTALARVLPSRPIFVKHLQMNGGIVVGGGGGGPFANHSNELLPPPPPPPIDVVEAQQQHQYFHHHHQHRHPHTTSLISSGAGGDDLTVESGQLSLADLASINHHGPGLEMHHHQHHHHQHDPNDEHDEHDRGRDFMLVFGGIDHEHAASESQQHDAVNGHLLAGNGQLVAPFEGPNLEPNIIFETAASTNHDQRLPRGGGGPGGRHHLEPHGALLDPTMQNDDQLRGLLADQPVDPIQQAAAMEQFLTDELAGGHFGQQQQASFVPSAHYEDHFAAAASDDEPAKHWVASPAPSGHFQQHQQLQALHQAPMATATFDHQPHQQQRPTRLVSKPMIASLRDHLLKVASFNYLFLVDQHQHQQQHQQQQQQQYLHSMSSSPPASHVQPMALSRWLRLPIRMFDSSKQPAFAGSQNKLLAAQSPLDWRPLVAHSQQQIGSPTVYSGTHFVSPSAHNSGGQSGAATATSQQPATFDYDDLMGASSKIVAKTSASVAAPPNLVSGGARLNTNDNSNMLMPINKTNGKKVKAKPSGRTSKQTHLKTTTFHHQQASERHYPPPRFANQNQHLATSSIIEQQQQQQHLKSSMPYNNNNNNSTTLFPSLRQPARPLTGGQMRPPGSQASRPPPAPHPAMMMQLVSLGHSPRGPSEQLRTKRAPKPLFGQRLLDSLTRPKKSSQVGVALKG